MNSHGNDYHLFPDTILDIKPEKNQNSDKKKTNLNSPLKILNNPEYLHSDRDIGVGCNLGIATGVGMVIFWPLYSWSYKILKSSWAEVVKHCGLTGSPFEICKSYRVVNGDPSLGACDQLDEACKQDTTRNALFGCALGCSIIMVGSCLYSIYRSTRPETDDLMEDRFGHHSLEILARFGITKYMSIAEAIQAIELLIQQTKECALLIPKDSWDLVGSYLAPMTIVKTNVEVKPEAKENLSHMKQFSSAEIIQQVRDDKRK